MGWTHTAGATKSDIIKDCIRVQGWGESREGLAIEHCVRGNVLWTVHVIREVTTHAEVARFIGCFLLRSNPGYGWGYKDMDESMGPCYYSCPLGYLDMVPCPDNVPYAKAWREKVRAYHANTIKLSDGLRLSISGSWKCAGSSNPITEITVRKYGRSWCAYMPNSAMPLKFPRRMLVGAKVLDR